MSDEYLKKEDKYISDITDPAKENTALHRMARKFFRENTQGDRLKGLVKEIWKMIVIQTLEIVPIELSLKSKGDLKGIDNSLIAKNSIGIFSIEQYMIEKL